MNHPLLQLARRTLDAALHGQAWRKECALPAPEPSRGCFVSLKLGGRLRGCIGTLAPTWPTLAEEVAENTLAAAFRDPRFRPVALAELERLRISIDLLAPAEPVESVRALDPRRYGLVVRVGSRCGVLLPDIPGVTRAEQQLEICKEKAGIEPGEPVRLERFLVERLRE